MVGAIVGEISTYPLKGETAKTEAAAKEIINTLYFGGGTPSILEIVDLEIIFKALHSRFVFANDIEITLEANPDDITYQKLQLWKQLGVTRFSVGIQSFDEAELQWMNRAHTSAESLVCIDKIRAAGFTNFSVDLIYGSPLLTDEGWKKNVMTVIEKNIPHISCYALTVEPKTALDKLITLQKKENVDADKQARQFLLLMEWMANAGYEHYEISNFAKPGLRSRHNSNYWSGEKYYGFGPSAHSYFPLGEALIEKPIRKWNIANNAVYIKAVQDGELTFEKEILTRTQELNEYIMTALRTMEGIDTAFITEKYGTAKKNQIISASNQYATNRKLKIDADKIILTNQGKLFADGIAADLFFTE